MRADARAHARLREPLQCVECDRVSREGERGWRAYLTGEDAEDEEPAEVVIYCPECDRREFGLESRHG